VVTVLLKAILLIAVVAVVIWSLYLLGFSIYNHYFNSARRDAAELKYHSDNLRKLIEKAENER
jgi:hypothetical protein